jgi:hypothetical protein
MLSESSRKLALGHVIGEPAQQAVHAVRGSFDVAFQETLKETTAKTGWVQGLKIEIVMLLNEREGGGKKSISPVAAVELHLPAYQPCRLSITYNPLVQPCELDSNISSVSLTNSCSCFAFV